MSHSFEKARKRLQTLQAEIARADKLYYQESTSEISDFEYDCLQAEVQAIYRQFPLLEQAMKVGSDLRGTTLPLPHPSPMLSLSNTYSREELLAFHQRTVEACGAPVSYVLEPKVDGMAINLIYEQGKWVRALTRGNGRAGEDVTAAIETIASIPRCLCEFPSKKTSEEWKDSRPSSAVDDHAKQVPSDASNQDRGSTIEVRGEVYITREDFEELNAEQERLGQPCFSNARNLASGSVKLLDIAEVRRRRLRFVAYGIGVITGELATQVAVREWLAANHFPVFPTIDVAKNFEEVWSFVEQFHAKFHPFLYQTDGVVLKMNDRSQQAALGATAKSPRWAIAYKFEPESAETQVVGVTFQVGRTGTITPVAELAPVDLCGSHISRATLHNFHEIERLQLQIGDWVVLQKAGEVIPAIVRVQTERRSETRPILPPTHCPACGSILVQADGEVALRCTSMACSAQTRLKILHFASKDALDFSGMGPKVVDALVRNGWLKTIADLFQLWRYRSQWMTMEGFGETAVDAILSSIEQAKTRPLWRWIYGLSIPSVGLEAAKNLAQAFPSLQALQAASAGALQAVPLIGERTAQGIVAFFQNLTNQKILQKLPFDTLQPSDNV
ncbi:MAG: NAD-dependent DNA ligase LigA [Opitutales bacterium]|nr:NAD-dependent DNA ligase LigA [Opitutales bacterium]